MKLNLPLVLLYALTITTVFCLPIPSYNEQRILSKLRQYEQNDLKARQQTYADKVFADSQRNTGSERAVAMANQLSGQLTNILHKAARNLLNKVESKPSAAPPVAPGPVAAPRGPIGVSPGMGVKLHFKAPQQPQYYYPPVEAPRRPRIIVPIKRPQPVSSVPSVHIHPVEPVQPVPPVQPVQTPSMPQVHVYPPQAQPPAQPSTPHLHIHPTSENQKVSIKPIPPMSPMSVSKPVKSAQPVQKAPVLHIHSPANQNGKKPGSKDKAENDVQLKLNMDFKAHNRTGFEALQRMVEQVEIQSTDALAREKAYVQRENVKGSLLDMLLKQAAIQELSDRVTDQVMQEVNAQYFGK